METTFLLFLLAMYRSTKRFIIKLTTTFEEESDMTPETSRFQMFDLIGRLIYCFQV